MSDSQIKTKKNYLYFNTWSKLVHFRKFKMSKRISILKKIFDLLCE